MGAGVAAATAAEPPPMGSSGSETAGAYNVDGVPHFPEPVSIDRVPQVIAAAESLPVPWWAFWRSPQRRPYKPQVVEVWQHVAYEYHVLGKRRKQDD